MRIIILVAALGVLLALSLAGAAYVWWDIGQIDIGIHGWIAMILGIVLSLALGGGLMALVFYSSRHGYDDQQNRPDD